MEGRVYVLKRALDWKTCVLFVLVSLILDTTVCIPSVQIGLRSQNGRVLERVLILEFFPKTLNSFYKTLIYKYSFEMDRIFK